MLVRAFFMFVLVSMTVLVFALSHTTMHSNVIYEFLTIV
jgi:hypothetical protein